MIKKKFHSRKWIKGDKIIISVNSFEGGTMKYKDFNFNRAMRMIRVLVNKRRKKKKKVSISAKIF